MAEFEMNGRRYRELPDGNVQDIGPAGGGGRIIPKSATTQRKEGADADKAVVDAQTGAATLPYAAPKIVADINSANASTAVTNEKLLDALINRERGGVGEEMRAKALDAFNAAPTLERVANDIEAAYRSGVGQTSGIAGVKDFFPTGENRQFGLIGGRMRGQLKQALGFTGGEGNTAGELTINYGPYIPDSWDTNEEVERKLASVRALAKEARKKAISYLGGIPDAAGRVTPLPRDMRPEQEQALFAGVPLEQAMANPDLPVSGMGAVSGVTSRGGFVPVESLRGIENEVIGMVRNGVPAEQIYSFLSQRYAETAPEHGGRLRAAPELQGFIADVIERHRAEPGRPIGELGSGWERLGGYEAPDEESSILGSLGETDLGAGIMAAANGVTGGNLANLAGGDARDVLGAARDQSPKSSFAGDVFGSANAMAATGGLGGRLGLGLLTRGGAIGSDMLYGGVRGASETQGGIGEKAAGGLLGLGLGAVGNLGGQYLLAPTIRTAANSRPGRAIADALANAGTAAGNAYRGVRGNAPLPYDGAGIPIAPSVAEQVVGRAVGNNSDPVAAALAAGRDIDMPVTLADTTPQLRQLAGAAYRRSDLDTQAQIERALTDRNLGQINRLESQIESSFGPVGNTNRIRDDLTEQARAAAGPLYQAFRAEPARTSPQLEAILATPDGQAALRNAQRIAANERRDPNALGFDLDELGNVRLTQTPSPETLDLIKRGLDDVVSSARNPVTGRIENDLGRSVEGIRRDYVSELDRLYPNTYPQARAAYAGPASMREAMEQGQGIYNELPRDIADQFGGLPPAQQELYQLGARRSMMDRASRATENQDPWARVFGRVDDQARVGEVFDADGINRFRQAFDTERAMAQTRNSVLGGSPTQARQALDDQLTNRIGEQLVNGVVDMSLTGAPVRAGLGLAGRLFGDRASLGFAGAREQQASEIARLLATERPTNEVADLLAESAAYRRYVDDLRLRYGRTGAALAVGGTGLAN